MHHLSIHPAAWTLQDTSVLLSCVLALAIIILAISLAKLPPFLAIIMGALAFSLRCGLPLEQAMRAFRQGAGALLGESGLIIALGALLGGMVAGSGAAERLVTAMLNPGGRPLSLRLLPWCVAGAAMLVGLPLFFEVGLVIMLPLIFGMARRSGQPVLRIAVPALAGMTVLHALVPPHPGPLIAITALHLPLGITLLLGLALAVPAVILAGPLYGSLLSRRAEYAAIGIPANLAREDHPAAGGAPPPSLTAAAATILLPVMLMLGRTVAEIGLPSASPVAHILIILGEPFMALLLSVFFAVIALGWARRTPRETVGHTLHDALPPLAVLLLTIGAGGGLKQVLLSAGIADTISKIALASPLPFVLLAWLVAVCLRQATGSATVATSTTAGLLAPLLPGMEITTPQSALVALAIGSGSVFFCHVNDAGFWMVHEFFGLTLRQTIMVWSVLQTIVSVTGIALCCALWPLFA